MHEPPKTKMRRRGALKTGVTSCRTATAKATAKEKPATNNEEDDTKVPVKKTEKEEDGEDGMRRSRS
jgi:hypothetical protein